MSVQLPAHLIPKNPKPEAQSRVEIEAHRDFTKGDIERLATPLGICSIPADRLVALRDLGVVTKRGTINIIHGGFLVSQDKMVEAIGVAAQVVNDPQRTVEERDQASRTIGYLSEKLAKVGLAQVKVDQTVFQVVHGTDKKRRSSFQPGMQVPIPVEEIKPVKT